MLVGPTHACVVLFSLLCPGIAKNPGWFVVKSYRTSNPQPDAAKHACTRSLIIGVRLEAACRARLSDPCIGNQIFDLISNLISHLISHRISRGLV